MAKQYYRGAHGVIIMYSITESSSFESVENWLNELEVYITEDTRMLLIGNKLDLSDKREVPRGDAISLSKEKKIAFLETSALEGENCTKAIQIILQEIHELHTAKGTKSSKPVGSGSSTPTGGTVVVGQVPEKPAQKPKTCGCG